MGRCHVRRSGVGHGRGRVCLLGTAEVACMRLCQKRATGCAPEEKQTGERESRNKREGNMARGLHGHSGVIVAQVSRCKTEPLPTLFTVYAPPFWREDAKRRIMFL